MINLLIAEDQPIMVEGLKLIFEDKEEIYIIDDVSNGLEMLSYVKDAEEDIHIVLADISMPEMSGLEAAEVIINSKALNTRIILYSMFINEANVNKAIKLGVDGYLDKGCAGSEIYGAIKEVHAGRKYYSKKVQDISKKAKELMMPTPREKEIIAYLEKGLSDGEIAAKLNIATSTVSDHIKNLRRKYGAGTRTELLYILRQKGLI